MTLPGLAFLEGSPGEAAETFAAAVVTPSRNSSAVLSSFTESIH